MANTSISATNINVPTKKRALRSDVWEHFVVNEIVDKDNPTISCKYCGATYGCDPRKYGTSNLQRHLQKCKKYLETQDAKQKKISSFILKKEGECSTSHSSAFTQEGGRDVIVRMLIEEELSLRLVEADSFKRAFTYFQPSFVVPSRRTVSRDIEILHLKEKNKLKAFFDKINQRVCLTTDGWTSSQTKSYMVLTGHFIDNSWNLHKRILNFREIDNHRGDTIGKMLETCLHEWGIQHILTITVDNASSNDTAISYLVRSLRQWKGLVLDGEAIHVRCFAQIINLIVNDGLKEHQPAIKRVQRVVKYVKSSPTRFQQFKTCIEMMKINFRGNVSLDTPTRWNSTFLMLDNAEKYEKAFTKIGEIDVQYYCSFSGEGGAPTEDDWAKIREFCKFLKAFYDVTLKVSASSNVTANLYIREVSKLKLTIDKYVAGDDSLLKTMALGMQTKFAKYWGDFAKMNPLTFVAVLLDPMCKQTMLRHCIFLLFGAAKVDELTTTVENVLKRLYSEYKGEDPSANVRMPPLPTFDILFSSLYTTTPNYETIGSKSEIEDYLAEKCAAFTEDFDILAWWKLNCHRYPTLSQIAKDVLITPISTVPSESAFSCGGRVVDPFRTSLLPKTVEALICTQNWIRSKFPSILDPVEDYVTLDEEIVASFEQLEIDAESQIDPQLQDSIRDKELPMIIE